MSEWDLGYRQAMEDTRLALGLGPAAGEFSPDFIAKYVEERIRVATPRVDEYEDASGRPLTEWITDLAGERVEVMRHKDDLRHEESLQMLSKTRKSVAAAQLDQLRTDTKREAALREEVREWKLRAAYNRHDHDVPPEHLGSGRYSAYRTGFEWAWRGEGYHDLYTRSDCRRALTDGYEDGQVAFAKAFRRARAAAARSTGTDTPTEGDAHE